MLNRTQEEIVVIAFLALLWVGKLCVGPVPSSLTTSCMFSVPCWMEVTGEHEGHWSWCGYYRRRGYTEQGSVFAGRGVLCL
jgi:hypothetical protein